MCAPDADRRRLRSVQTLVSEDSFQGRIIWLEGISAPVWDTWAEFFLEYEHATRAISPSRQTHFLVQLKGFEYSFPIPVAVGVSKRVWDGWLRRSDMLLYGAFRVEERESALKTDLASALVATLAAWDPDLCEWLASLSLEQLINPEDILADFTNRRSWINGSYEMNEKMWSLGYWHTVEGRLDRSLCQIPIPCIQRHKANNSIQGTQLRIFPLLTSTVFATKAILIVVTELPSSRLRNSVFISMRSIPFAPSLLDLNQE
jgi:hypothetical protein